jgi:hypothetical protein
MPVIWSFANGDAKDLDLSKEKPAMATALCVTNFLLDVFMMMASLDE